MPSRGWREATSRARLHRLAADRPATRFLLGNHEEVFLDALNGDPKALRMFCRIGGRETILSYGVDSTEYDRMDYDELHQAMQRHVPAERRPSLVGPMRPLKSLALNSVGPSKVA